MVDLDNCGKVVWCPNELGYSLKHTVIMVIKAPRGMMELYDTTNKEHKDKQVRAVRAFMKQHNPPFKEEQLYLIPLPSGSSEEPPDGN